MKVTWLFQKYRAQDDTVVDNLIKAVKDQGDDIYIEPYVPFGGTDYSKIPLDKPVVCMGSIASVRGAQRHIGTAPVCWADWNKFACSTYYCHYHDYLSQGRWFMLPFGALPVRKFYCYDTLGIPSECIFIRPDKNTKIFGGEVVHKNQFDRWYKYTKTYVDENEIVVVGNKQTLGREWRVVVFNGRAISGSQYINKYQELDLQAGCPTEVLSLCEEITKKWMPHRILCLDIVEVEVSDSTSTLRLLEIGSVNCCGFYLNDSKLVAQAIHDAAVEEYVEENSL